MSSRVNLWTLLVVLAVSAPARAQEKKSTSSSAATKGSTELLFQLAVPNKVILKSVVLEMMRLGRIRYVTLSDDGSVSGDQPHDGVWTGRFQGPFVRTMSVRLFVGQKKSSMTAAYEGVVRMVDSRQDGLSWRLERGRGGWVASPTAAAFPGRHGTVSEVLPTVAVFGWGVFLVALVALLLMRRRPPEGSGSPPRNY